MTIEELIEKYGDVELKFDSYYKYRFTFSGKAPDGKIISWTYGGNSSDIYKYSVTRDGIKTLNKIFDDPLSVDNDYFRILLTDNGYEVISNDY